MKPTGLVRAIFCYKYTKGGRGGVGENKTENGEKLFHCLAQVVTETHGNGEFICLFFPKYIL